MQTPVAWLGRELVNLFLCGQAVSNVLDDNVELDSGDGSSTLLKGIKHHCDVGLLSLFEHHNICKVWSRLKTPLFPHLGCHIRTLLGLQREPLTNQDGSRQIDLYYYEGAGQSAAAGGGDSPLSSRGVAWRRLRTRGRGGSAPPPSHAPFTQQS
ncbi:unnamed protein product [Merluccius merluccius]